MKHLTKSDLKTILWVSLFGISFGMVEAAVVIYVRELYYPLGFSFPIPEISHKIIFTELWRELATIIMLVAIGILAGKTKVQRFAYFLISFAVWDIFYYVFLKIFIHWPASIFTWDVLFLIPVAWIGPVWAPVLLSILMIGFGILLIKRNQSINAREWVLLINGAFICIISFVADLIAYLNTNANNVTLMEDVSSLSHTYVPESYDWWIFAIGLAFIGSGIALYNHRTSTSNKRLMQMQLFI